MGFARAIDASYLIFAIPLALFAVPWPEPVLWPIFAGVWIIHVIYKVLQAMAYSRGAYTVVYPVVRGTGPLATVIVAGFVLWRTVFRGAMVGRGHPDMWHPWLGGIQPALRPH